LALTELLTTVSKRILEERWCEELREQRLKYQNLDALIIKKIFCILFETIIIHILTNKKNDKLNSSTNN